MPRAINRRHFLVHLGAGGALGALPRLHAAPRRVGANDRIGLGIIGVGSLGGGGHHLGRVLKMPDFEVLAVCDVDASRVESARQKTGNKAVGYRDYRQLLDRKDIDAVIIVTPDHWHALIAIHACEAGKDVYCEKPLSLTVAEGRAMASAARRFGRVFQTGTQQRSDTRFRWACELVQNGKIGRIERVKAVIGRGPTSAPVPDEPPPPELDWEMWLGPAPAVPYNRKRCHYTFRWYYDYSGGKMTDWGAHHHDIVQWALGTELSGPIAVDARGLWPADNFFETAVDFDVTYTYESGITLHTTSAGENGITFYGSEGELFVARGKIRAEPKEILDTQVGTMPVRLYESRSHHQNFVDCLRSRKLPISDVELSHRSATVCHIGNIAMLLGRRLAWDPGQERFPNDEAANRLLHKPMRGEWSL